MMDGLAMDAPRSGPRSAGTGLTAPQRPRLDVAVRDEALLDGPRDRLPKQPLDAAQEVRLVDADKADRIAGRAGSAAAPAAPATPDASTDPAPA